MDWNGQQGALRLPAPPRTWSKDPLALDGHAILEQHLTDINRIIEIVARRGGFDEETVEEFRSEVYVKLLKDDAAVLTGFGGRSSLKTYLSAVITNAMRDYRNRLWGKWRPSTRAVDLGEVAIRLETMVFRDGQSPKAAVEALVGEGVAEPMELYEVLESLPTRWPVKHVSEDELGRRRRPDRAPDEDVAHGEVRDAMEVALAGLTPEQQIVVRMHYWDGLSLAEIARRLGLKQRSLYTLMGKCHELLGRAIAAEGIRPEDLQ